MLEFKYPEFPVLIVDDEVNALDSFEITLNSCGIENIVLCRDSREVLQLLKSRKLVLIMINFPSQVNVYIADTILLINLGNSIFAKHVVHYIMKFASINK